MAKPKSDEAINFDSVIKNLSPDTKVSDTPWFKKKSSIIAMSSTLGVGALVTVIAVPIALTSGSTSSGETTPNPTPPPKYSTDEEIKAAIAGFNVSTKEQKIAGYNKFVNANREAIVFYFKNGIGMGKFYDANVHQPISTSEAPNTSAAQTNFDKLRARFNTTGQLINGTDKGTFNLLNDFLAIKGVFNGQTNEQIGPGLGETNFATESYYCNANDALQISDPNFMTYTFLSPVVSSISNVTLNSDFTINMALTDQTKNISFYLQVSTSTTQKSLYKTNLTFNNDTLFPGMGSKFAEQILKLNLRPIKPI